MVKKCNLRLYTPPLSIQQTNVIFSPSSGHFSLILTIVQSFLIGSPCPPMVRIFEKWFSDGEKMQFTTVYSASQHTTDWCHFFTILGSLFTNSDYCPIIPHCIPLSSNGPNIWKVILRWWKNAIYDFILCHSAYDRLMWFFTIFWSLFTNSDYCPIIHHYIPLLSNGQNIWKVIHRWWKNAIYNSILCHSAYNGLMSFFHHLPVTFH